MARAGAAIGGGEFNQVKLCRRLATPLAEDADLTELAGRLLAGHPAPYFSVVQAPGIGVVSASPERFLPRDGPVATTQPVSRVGIRGRRGRRRELHCQARAGAAGAVLRLLGWLDADAGRADLAVAIRNFWQAAGELRFGTGAGITWASDPAGEWAETELKARRLLSLV